MNPIQCGAAALLVTIVVSGCSSKSDDSSSSTKPDKTTTTKNASGAPQLPSPLPRVEDLGTADPILGDFPADESRDYQFAWVNLAPNGRQFTVSARATSEMLKDFNEADIYMDGVIACTDLRENYSVADIITDTGTRYQSDENPITDDEVFSLGALIIANAVSELCPDMKVLVDDPDLQVPTPTVIRTVLGLEERDLDDATANRFANFICEELNRGTTKSRLVSNIADDFGYPDDLVETIVTYTGDSVC